MLLPEQNEVDVGSMINLPLTGNGPESHLGAARDMG